MLRVFALIAALVCACPVFAADLSDSFDKPALNVNFDGSHHVDVCHRGPQQEAAPQSNAKEDLTFEKTPESEVPVSVLIGAGLVAGGIGVAVAVSHIAKSTVAVH